MYAKKNPTATVAPTLRASAAAAAGTVGPWTIARRTAPTLMQSRCRYGLFLPHSLPPPYQIVCPCKYQTGSCTYEDKGCRFLGLPVSTCEQYLKGKCKETNCKFTHLAPPMCPHVFQNGNCSFAEGCVLSGRPVDECSFALCNRGAACPRRHQFHTTTTINGEEVRKHPTKPTTMPNHYNNNNSYGNEGVVEETPEATS